MKTWIAWYDCEHSRLVFEYTEDFDRQFDADLNPGPWIRAEAIAEVEDGKTDRTFSISPIDIDYSEAMAAFQEARARVE